MATATQAELAAKPSRRVGGLEMTVPLAGLADALRRVSACIAPKSTLPVLSTVLVTADERGLTLAATDLDRWVSSTVPDVADGSLFQIHSQGVVALPAKLLSNAVTLGTGTSATVRVTSGTTPRASLEIGAARYALPTVNAAEFPPSPDIALPEDVARHRTTAGVLSRALKRVAHATSTEESRPTIQGILVEPEEQGLLLVATDGASLVRLRVAIDAAVGRNVILPRSTAAAIGTVFDADELLTLHQDTKETTHFGATSALRTLRSRTIEGPYPQWRQVVPKETRFSVTFDRAALLSAIRRLAFVDSEALHRVRMTVTDGSTELRVASELGEAIEHLTCATDGIEAAFTIAFSAGLLINHLTQTFAGERVVVGLTNPTSAIMLTDPADADVLALLMPIRLETLP